MLTEITIGNHQEVLDIPEEWLCRLEKMGFEAVRFASEYAIAPDCPLLHLESIDVALVDDETSAKVHADFMNIPGATDVITFHHGEIVIGVEVAKRQAHDYAEPLEREILRYFVHGLLHLAGHEDAEKAERENMHRAQETIVMQLWKVFCGDAI